VREQPIPIQQSVTCVFSVESWLPLQDDTIYALPSVYVAELPINITENGVRHMVQEAFSGTLRYIWLCIQSRICQPYRTQYAGLGLDH